MSQFKPKQWKVQRMSMEDALAKGIADKIDRQVLEELGCKIEKSKYEKLFDSIFPLPLPPEVKL
jgi:hypothetical protein